MPDLPTPAATRLARARWLDTRLLLGVLLVLVSVVVGAKILAEADDTVRVWSVRRDLGADTTLSHGDLASRSVRLQGASTRYVSAAEDLDGLVLSRPLSKDELVPLSAVSRPGATDLRRVVIEVDRFGAARLRKGGVVDVYAVRKTTGTAEPAKPQLVLAGVTVAENVDGGSRSFSGSSARAGVTLSVARADVPTLIDAVANATVYVVQVPVPSGVAAGTGTGATGGR